MYGVVVLEFVCLAANFTKTHMKVATDFTFNLGENLTKKLNYFVQEKAYFFTQPLYSLFIQKSHLIGPRVFSLAFFVCGRGGGAVRSTDLTH